MLLYHSGLFQPPWTPATLTTDILEKLENRVAHLGGGSPLSWRTWFQAAINPACSALLEQDTEPLAAPSCAVARLCRQRRMNVLTEIKERHFSSCTSDFLLILDAHIDSLSNLKATMRWISTSPSFTFIMVLVFVYMKIRLLQWKSGSLGVAFPFSCFKLKIVKMKEVCLTQVKLASLFSLPLCRVSLVCVLYEISHVVTGSSSLSVKTISYFLSILYLLDNSWELKLIDSLNACKYSKFSESQDMLRPTSCWGISKCQTGHYGLLGSCFKAGNNEIAQDCTQSLPLIPLSSSTG